MKEKNKPVIIAISGVKNSGKTPLIERILPKPNNEGLKVATVKHDGHDFDADIEGTDTFKHRNAGAYGTAILSKNKFMVIKEQKNTHKYTAKICIEIIKEQLLKHNINLI